MLRVHVGLDFKDKRCELFVRRLDRSFFCLPRLRLRGQFEEFFQKRFYAEVCHGGTEEHRRERAVLYFFHRKFVACRVQQFNVVDKGAMDLFRQQFFKCGIGGGTLGGG